MKIRIVLTAVLFAIVALSPASSFAAGKGKKKGPPVHHETTISTVSPTSITISEDKSSKTFTVSQFTEVTINGAKATVADLKPGMLVSVTLRDSSNLSRISATTK